MRNAAETVFDLVPAEHGHPQLTRLIPNIGIEIRRNDPEMVRGGGGSPAENR